MTILGNTPWELLGRGLSGEEAGGVVRKLGYYPPLPRGCIKLPDIYTPVPRGGVVSVSLCVASCSSFCS